MATKRKEGKVGHVPVQSSAAFKEQMRIGGEIAACLPQVMSQADVGKHFGISQQMVSRIERRALFKIRSALLLKRGESIANQLAK